MIPEMRRVIAALLLVCLGMIFPLAGSPVRLCLLDHKLLVPGFSSCSMETAKKAPCCHHGGKKDHDKSPCCLELDDLPDATPPATPDAVPPAMVTELPEPMFPAPLPVFHQEPVFRPSMPIRGPDNPASRRAILEVWRL